MRASSLLLLLSHKGKKEKKREKFPTKFFISRLATARGDGERGKKESERLRGGVVEATKSLCVDPPGGFLFFFVVVETKKGLVIDFWQRLQIFEDAEENALFVRRWHTQKHQGEEG